MFKDLKQFTLQVLPNRELEGREKEKDKIWFPRTFLYERSDGKLVSLQSKYFSNHSILLVLHKPQTDLKGGRNETDQPKLHCAFRVSFSLDITHFEDKLQVNKI